MLVSIISAAQPHTPEHGSAERKAIMNALRAPVMEILNQSVAFKADWLKVQDDWAFMHGQALQPNGQPVNYSITPYQDYINEGLFTDWICALLQRKEERWEVVRYVIGDTVMVYQPWPRRYGAPREIFDFR